MTDLRVLPDDQQKTFLEHCSRGHSAWQSEGDLAAAEVHFLRAWAVIPEPKNAYDETSSFLRGMLDFCIETEQLQKAGQWLPQLAECFGDESPETLFRTGEIHYLAGRLDDAFAIFERLYKTWGRRPFAGENPVYLEFYNARSRR